ncbi:transcription factor E4F1-like [Ceratina calcarata]|uniref:Transcription factor E4F1-like n=1 Tax=Ceratina calcarata TaxID=156304 RepID=A0AAJ7S3F0_9HYME|nr:transcription factor E4F1-like [Ceratina calcarata]
MANNGLSAADYEMLAVFDDESALSTLGDLDTSVEDLDMELEYSDSTEFDKPVPSPTESTSSEPSIHESWDWVLVDLSETPETLETAEQLGIRPQQILEIQQENKTNNENERHVFVVPKIYECMFCTKLFYNTRVLRTHQIDHAKQQLRCKYCNKRELTLCNLRRHIEYYHYSMRRYVLAECSY